MTCHKADRRTGGTGVMGQNATYVMVSTVTQNRIPRSSGSLQVTFVSCS